MAPKRPASNKAALVNRSSDSDRECDSGEGHEYFYIGTFTEYRPPHLNDGNFSCTQPTGSSTQPRRYLRINNGEVYAGENTGHVVIGSDANYTFMQYAPSSANTDSTLKRGDPFVPRPDLSYYINRNYIGGSSDGDGDDNTQPLTTAAVAALDYANQTQSFDGNVYGWLPRVGRAEQADPMDYWSTTHLMAKAPGSRSSATTSMSWCVVPSSHEPCDVEALRDVGRWSDVPTDPATVMARNIRDEDVSDAS
ncbi:hypothetical protein F5Y11DRAFT_61398 [Daldinia sp. FL1419]|nr:hypothetical protein F5Y11DRAFT_61398 [Daldinia sp. FL1419]